MDMKKILQAMDSASTKPVEGSSDMAKFLRVVSEADINQPTSTLPPEQLEYNKLRAQVDSLDFLQSDSRNTYVDQSPELAASQDAMRQKLEQMEKELLAKGIDARAEYDAPEPTQTPNQSVNEDLLKLAGILKEGANPHKVSLPVQMAMQHYQKPVEKAKPRARLIDKYFTEAEATIVQKKQEEKQLLKQYAQTIAERVLMKEGKKTESFNPNMSPNPGFKPTAGPGIMSSVAEDNTPDTITLDVPLMIRLMEYAREDAKDDLALHDVAEQLVGLSSKGKTLSMADYESIVSNQVNEEKATFATTGGGAAVGNPNITNKKTPAVSVAQPIIQGEGLNAAIVVDGVEIYSIKDFLVDLGFSAAIIALGTALAAPSGGSSEMVAAAAIANPIRRVFTYVVKYAVHLAKSGTLSKEAITNYVKSRYDVFAGLLKDNLAPAALKATIAGTALFNTVAGILEKYGLLPEWMQKEKPFDPENPEASVSLR